MNCELFMAALASGVVEGPALEHMRSCSRCLETAVDHDPDFLFRSLGGDNLVPPGGIDGFVSEVMHEVQVRTTEKSLRRPQPLVRRWMIAAAMAGVAVTGAVVIRPSLGPSQPVPAQVATVSPQAAPVALLNRPIVENYDSAGATIVEMTAGESSDIALVMVFDESLPVDL